MSLSSPVVAVCLVVLSWWLSTGVVLGLVWQPERHHRAILTLATIAAMAASGVLVIAGREATVTSAYVGFASALALWAWHELAFLLGFVTGPNKAPCAPEARGWARFTAATATLIHHEVALAATLVAIVAITWNAANHVASGTFFVLWSMRLSSKFNLFLGVRNVTVEFVPMKLRHLVSYFGQAQSNPLMPVALVGSSLALTALVTGAVRAFDVPDVSIAYTIVATLLALAVLEHVFLCVPLSEATLWRWALPRRDRVVRAAMSGDK